MTTSEEVILKIIDSKLICFAVGGFGKHLNDGKNDIKDLDFCVPSELNKIETIKEFLKKFDEGFNLNNFNFDRIIRIRYKTIKIDRLKRADFTGCLPCPVYTIKS